MGMTMVITKLKILGLNCSSIRSQAKKNNPAVLLSEHDIDIVLRRESHIVFLFRIFVILVYNIKKRQISSGGVFRSVVVEFSDQWWWSFQRGQKVIECI